MVTPDGCWIWSGHLDRDGYGTFWKDKKNRRASHIAWELNGGKVDDGYCLRSKCGNRACVNPSHLSLELISIPIEDRFWDKVDIKGADECWEWTAWKNNRGYGQIGLGRKLVLAHRVSWELKNGPIPKGMEVLHKCDNPACVNPNHLFTGSQKDNMDDMAEKGRRPMGKDVWNAKLTKEDVVKIRESNKKQAELAAIYDVTQSHISDIISHRRWSWVN